jgi:hypothetical protein
MSLDTKDIISFIKRDVEATKASSRGRIGIVIAYVLVPAWFLGRLGVLESFDVENNPPNFVHFGVVCAFAMLGASFFLSLGKASFIRLGVLGALLGAAIMLGFGYFGQMSLSDFAWAPPQTEDWANAWSCAGIGVITGIVSSVVMLGTLFAFGPFPTKSHHIAVSVVSASVGLMVLTLYCPMNDVFHSTVGHLSQFALLFGLTWVTCRLLARFVVIRKLGASSRALRGLF